MFETSSSSIFPQTEPQTSSSSIFPQFDHTSLANTQAGWQEWVPVMQSSLHSVVLGHTQAGAIIDYIEADLLSAWIYKAKPTYFYFPGYFILLHNLAERRLSKRNKQKSARGKPKSARNMPLTKEGASKSNMETRLLFFFPERWLL